MLYTRPTILSDYSLPIKLKKLFILFFIFGTFLVIIETVLSPHPSHAKSLLVFPAFKLSKFTFTVVEFYNLLFIFLFLFLIILNFSLNSNFSFNFAPSKIMNFLVLIFVINVFLAIVIGIMGKNENLFGHLRNMIGLLVIFPFYYFRKTLFKFRRFIFFSINILGLYFIIFTLIKKTYGSYLFTLNLKDGEWFGLYFSSFFLAYHLFKILIEKKNSFLSLFYVLLTLTAFLISLEYKPVILPALVILGFAFLILKFIYKKKLTKFLFFSSLIILVIYPFTSTYYKDDQLLKKSIQRWTKIEFDEKKNLNLIDIFDNLKKIKLGGTRDISGGRFLIWKYYFSEGIKYPIITPYFGTKGPDIITPNNQIINRPAHNIFFKYIYHVGLPSALCILLLIYLFLTKGWWLLKYNNQSTSLLSLKPFEALAVYTFIIGMISTQLVGGPIGKSPLINWYFWCLVTLFFSNFENKKKVLLIKK